jgi:hypothetical protein
MRRIGILTYHRSINYGSFLQCYSLMKGIMDKTDFEVEVINYNHFSTEKIRYTDLMTKNIPDIPRRTKKLLLFHKYINNDLNLSKAKLITDSTSKAAEFINSQNYDAVVVGSDEVWKITERRGFPNIYWLGEKLNCKKFSYAASLNKSETLPQNMDETSSTYMKEALLDYTYIGVRDMLTKNQVAALDDKIHVNMNCDPTFMYKLNPEVRESLRDKLVNQYKIDFSKPVIGIMTTNDKVGERLKQLYGGEYELVSFHVRNKYADKFIYDINPYEFAEIFSYFLLVVTSFFHGTIFSIKNNVPFITIEDNPLYKEYTSKINDLLTRNGIPEYYMYMSKEFNMNQFDERSRYLLDKKGDVNFDSIVHENRKLFQGFVENLKKSVSERTKEI